LRRREICPDKVVKIPHLLNMDTKIHQNTATSGEVEKFGQLVKEHDNEEKTETIKVALDGKKKVDDVIIGEDLKKSMERHGKPNI
jgi:hypothetical protein